MHGEQGCERNFHRVGFVPCTPGVGTWLTESFSSRLGEGARALLCSQTEMERAVELRIWVFRCNPEILHFLHSRGSGGKEPEKQLSLGTVSSVMETSTHQLAGFWTWSVEPSRSLSTYESALIVWGILTPRSASGSALLRLFISDKSIFSASVCRTSTSQAGSSLSLSLKIPTFLPTGPGL